MKVDSSDNTKTLDGAVFRLYRYVNSNKQVAMVGNGPTGTVVNYAGSMASETQEDLVKKLWRSF